MRVSILVLCTFDGGRWGRKFGVLPRRRRKGDTRKVALEGKTSHATLVRVGEKVDMQGTSRKTCLLVATLSVPSGKSVVYSDVLQRTAFNHGLHGCH